MHNLIDADTVRRLVAQELAAAERAYTTHLGGTTVCQLTKDGHVSGGLKYSEGRFIALRQVQRRFDTVVPPAQNHVQAALEHELAAWRQDLDAHQQKEHPSMPWVAYCQGGVDALRQILAIIDSANASQTDLTC